MPDTPDLAALAAEQIRVLREERARLDEKIAKLEHALEILQQDLTESKEKINVNDMLHKSRVRHSEGRGQSALVKAANAANMTMDEVAAVLGCSAALLSAAAHGKKSISMAYARRVEELLGKDSKGNPRYPATKVSWKKLRLE